LRQYVGPVGALHLDDPVDTGAPEPRRCRLRLESGCVHHPLRVARETSGGLLLSDTVISTIPRIGSAV
jgi:hypothetical protein